MNKLKAFVTLLLSAIGIFGAREFYKPRNIKDLLKGRGVKLASDNNAGKSMFFEHKDELKDLKIESPEGLGNGCAEKFKGTNLSDDQAFEQAKKYCSDSATSIMGRIIRAGEDHKVIKKGDKEAFRINYLLTANRDDVNKLIGISGVGTVEGDKITANFEKWCEDQEREKILTANDKDKLGNFKKRCYNLEVKTYKQLLEKQGKKRMTEEAQFKSKFRGKMEYVKDLMEEIKKIFNGDGTSGNNGGRSQLTALMNSREVREREKYKNGDGKDEDLLKEEGGRLYKSWCLSKWDKQLIGESLSLVDFNKFSFRCAED